MVYGPKSAHKHANYKQHRNKSLMELDDIVDDDIDDDEYDEIYDNCRIMLTYFNHKLLEMHKQFKKLMKRNDDWNINKNGKYSQYARQKEKY